MQKKRLSMQRDWIKLHPTDNLIVALRDLTAGTALHIENQAVTLVDSVPAKHKFTLQPLDEGEELYMYGVLVGKCKEALVAGSLVTTKNMVHAAQEYGGKNRSLNWSPPDISHWKDRTFDGYRRADGTVGTANYWLVIPLVFCENRNIETLREALLQPLGYAPVDRPDRSVNQLIEVFKAGGDAGAITSVATIQTPPPTFNERIFRNVDGIKFLTHQGGCGGTREDARSLCDLLAGYLCNPNVAGATVLSLGCQNAQITMFREALDRRDPDFSKPLRILEQQGGGSERQFIDRAIRQTFTGLMEADRSVRAPAPLSKITLGLECGGSDGFSGISANPVLGHVSDMLVALGGRAILAEFPELNGVEQELVDRCSTPELAQKFATLMRKYSAAAEAVGSSFASNPSPGNIRDGLITDAMKSAGAAKKGGSSPVVAVLEYTAPVPTKSGAGLSLLCTPGNDVESTTALAGSGANLIAFTTGLGTPTGNPVAPVIKISSNNKLADRMADLIDFNAGPVITGELTIAEAADQLLELIIEVASGQTLTAAQRLGQDDFIPWKRGISL